MRVLAHIHTLNDAAVIERAVDALQRQTRKPDAIIIAEGRIRNMPVERILGVLSDLLYGTMITNYFIGRQKPIEEQARDILDVVYNGILTDSERQARGRVK